MGADWDSFKQGRLKNYAKPPGGRITDTEVKFKDFKYLPNVANQKANPKCLNCGKYKWGHKTGDQGGGGKGCECDHPQFATDHSTRETFIAFMTEVMAECLRVIRPGGHALVWALPRTSHWTGMALEDAGWECREKLYHCFGSGFPKSLAVDKAIDKYLNGQREVIGINEGAKKRACKNNFGQFPSINPSEQGINSPKFAQHAGEITAPATPEAAQWQGWGTATKPAVEEWILARKPLSEKNIAQNVLTWGCGGLNIDATRVGIAEDDNISWREGNYTTKDAYFGGSTGTPYRKDKPQGRFSANLLMSHDPRCIARGTKRVRATRGPYPYSQEGDTTPHAYGKYQQRSEVTHTDEHGLEEVQAFECVEGCPVAELDRQSGIRKSGGGVKSKAGHSIGFLRGEENWHFDHDGKPYEASEGSAARYFQQFHDPLETLDAPFHYFSKASRRERNQGCEDMPAQYNDFQRASSGLSRSSHDKDGQLGTRSSPASNHHPTVKPLQLMSWLCRLVGVPGGVILDPFAGSGSTLVACIREGFSFIGIEQELEYVNIARARIAHAQQEARRSESEGQEYDCVEECPIKVLDAQSGIRKSGGVGKGAMSQTAYFGNGKGAHTPENSHASDGGASRYFQQFPPEPVSLWDEEVTE